MPKLKNIIAGIAAFVFICVFPTYAENTEYTIKQYIKDYYHNIYNEDTDSFEKIRINDTERPNELWSLSGDLNNYDLFENEISEVDNTYVVQTIKRYYIKFESPLNNLLYLCITESGEMFFGRYADYNKPNYCEYRIKDAENVLKRLAELCQPNTNGYINQKASVSAETDTVIVPEKSVNLNSGASSQIIPFPIGENCGYWEIKVNNEADKSVSVRIYADTPENEAIFFGIAHPKTETIFKCEKNAPFESGNYYMSVNTDGTCFLDGILSYRLTETYAAFGDISGHWAEKTIDKWADKGVISGYPDGTFKPDNPVTRAELAKILTLAFDLQPCEFTYNGNGLNENDWYYPYLFCASKYIPVYALPESNEKNKPYIDNRNENAFLPETPAMRMHVAESFVEIEKEHDKTNVELPTIQDIAVELEELFPYEDYGNLYPMHGKIPNNVSRMHEYIYLAVKLNIMHGDTDGYFRPYDNVTRAELITMLDRMI